MQSLRFENKLYAQVKQKMEEMQQHNMSWIEVQFLKKAVDVLCQCRATLMYTYVFAFYLKKNNQSIIFEVGENTVVRSSDYKAKESRDLMLGKAVVPGFAQVSLVLIFCGAKVRGPPVLGPSLQERH